MNLNMLLILVVFVVLGATIYHIYFTQHNNEGYEASPTIETNINLPTVRTQNETVNQRNTTQTNVTSEAEQQNTTENNIHFYIFGVSTCPHCQNLKSKIIEFYGSKSLTFYNLVTEEESKKYGNAFETLTKYTFSSGVPQVGIFENGHLKVIILGDFGTDENFKDRVNYYLITVNNLIQEYHQEYILIHSSKGVYYVNNTKEIQTLTDVFLHPEKFVQSS